METKERPIIDAEPTHWKKQETDAAIDILQSGPFSLREVAIKNFDEFFDSIIDQNGLTEAQHETLGNYLKESIERRDRLGAFLKRIEVEADAIRAEEKRLANRRREFEKIGEAMRDSIRMQLDNWGVKKVEGQKFTFALHKSPSAVEITDESLIPAEFIDYKPVVKKNEIARAIADGREVPGAEVLPDRTHLVIR